MLISRCSAWSTPWQGKAGEKVPVLPLTWRQHQGWCHQHHQHCDHDHDQHHDNFEHHDYHDNVNQGPFDPCVQRCEALWLSYYTWWPQLQYHCSQVNTWLCWLWWWGRWQLCWWMVFILKFQSCRFLPGQKTILNLNLLQVPAWSECGRDPDGLLWGGQVNHIQVTS